MVETCRPLLDMLATVPDVRGRRGRRHPLSALLALACAATLCGARSYSAIAEWGRNAGEELTRALGFTHQTMPCAATFYLVFRRLDWPRLEAVLAAWALWPQNSGGPAGLGSCGYPSVMAPTADPGDFRQCFDAGNCASVMQPLPWAGAVTHQDLMNH